MLDILQAIELTPDGLELIRGKDCGGEDYQKVLADWPTHEAANDMVNRGTRVWAYTTALRQIVGYSSLGVMPWAYPKKKSEKRSVVIIPAVAVWKEHWGKPDDEGDKVEDRYSSQIMRHLIAEAENWPEPMPALGLFVHPDNIQAINFYTRFKFTELIHVKSKDRETGVVHTAYVLDLPLRA